MGHRRVSVTVAAVLGALAPATAVASSAGASASGNLERARSEAARRLALLQVPPGAVELGSEPSVLRSPAYDEATPNLVDSHHWWRIRGNAASVLAYVTGRLPRDATPFVSGSGGPAPVYQMKSFDWVNSMGIAQPGTTSCPLLDGPIVTFVFRAAGGVRVARASGMDFDGTSGQCNALNLRIRGRSEPPLLGNLFRKVERLLGVRLERSSMPLSP